MSGLLSKLLLSPQQKLERILRLTGKVDKLEKLLKAHQYKLDVHTAVFKGGFSALQLCSLHGHADCVTYLITQQRVNVNHVNPLDNSTALHVAACGGSLAVVQALVELGGANMNCLTEMGFTPLHYAALGGKEDVYIYLISTGLIDVSFRTAEGITPLLLAARAGQTKACQYLVEFAAVSVDEADHNGCTALHYAAVGGNEGLVKYLISAGANLNSKDKKGRSPLDLCSHPATALLMSRVEPAAGGGGGGGSGGRRGSSSSGGGSTTGSLYSFLAGTGSPATSSEKTSTASDRDTTTDNSFPNRYKVVDTIYAKLETVCRSGRVSELEKIVARRPDLNDLLFPGGWNCLHLCAQKGHTACLELLVFKAKLDVDKENDKNGITALHIACRFNFLSCIEVLVAKGNVNCRTFKGKVPLHFSATHGDVSACEVLLFNGGDTYAQDVKGKTALMLAVMRGKADIVRILLQFGADPNLQDSRGRTALHMAYGRGSQGVVAALLEMGADESIRTNRGKLPVEYNLRGGGGGGVGVASSSSSGTSNNNSHVAKTAARKMAASRSTAHQRDDDDKTSENDFDGWMDSHGADSTDSSDDGIAGAETDSSDDEDEGFRRPGSKSSKKGTKSKAAAVVLHHVSREEVEL